MRLFFQSSVLICASLSLGWGQAGVAEATPANLSERAGELARSGRTAEALPMYEAALAQEPNNLEIRADYATVLGWAERYRESIAQFRLVTGPNQPDPPIWVLREASRSQLFGGDLKGAMATLNQLIGLLDDAEVTLCRRGLALRWLDRPKEAETAYRDALKTHPASTMAQIGIIYSLADQNRIQQALALVNQMTRQQPDNRDFAKVKSQILNWMGRHREAGRVLHGLGGADDREILESRVSAARWGGEPAEARRVAKALVARYPVPAAKKLNRDIELEYGKRLGTSARLAHDTDGLTDRLIEQVFGIHAGAANRFEFAVEQRKLSMEESVGWRRATLSWSGQLSSRFSSYAAVNQVNYHGVRGSSPFFGDGALTFAASDRVRISGGGGNTAVDAFRAVQNRIKSDFFFGEISIKPRPSVEISAKFARSRFSDSVQRNKADSEAFIRLHTSRKLRLDVGGSVNWLSHSRESENYFSPPDFYSMLGRVRFSGRLSPRFEYNAQIGAGAQREGALALESPLVATGTFFAKISPHWILQIDGGRSTSSLERINPGRQSYARTVLAAGLVYRFE